MKSFLAMNVGLSLVSFAFGSPVGTPIESAPSATATSKMEYFGDVDSRDPDTAALSLASRYAMFTKCLFAPQLNDTACDKLQGNLTDYQPFFGEDKRGLGVLGIDKLQKAVVVSFFSTKNGIDWFDDFRWDSVDVVASAGGKCDSRSMNNLSSDCYSKPACQLTDRSDFSDVKLHGGYLVQYCAVRAQVQQLLKATLEVHPGFAVTFTGHSLGGAVASIAAFDHEINRAVSTIGDVNLLTIGQPKVGNQAFVKAMTSFKFKRYILGVRNGDIIPFTPILREYMHMEPIVCFSKGIVAKTLNKDCTDIAANFNVFSLDTKSGDLLRYHRMENYAIY